MQNNAQTVILGHLNKSEGSQNNLLSLDSGLVGFWDIYMPQKVEGHPKGILFLKLRYIELKMVQQKAHHSFGLVQQSQEHCLESYIFCFKTRNCLCSHRNMTKQNHDTQGCSSF